MKQPERYVEPRLTQYLFDRASRTLTPLSGTFELSPVCNLACKMCYVRKTPAEVAASPRPPVGLIQWLSIAEQARDAIACLRGVLGGIFDAATAESTYILYGGSMNEKNAFSLLSMKGVDGGLIGGASLDAEKFISIIKAYDNTERKI